MNVIHPVQVSATQQTVLPGDIRISLKVICQVTAQVLDASRQSWLVVFLTENIKNNVNRIKIKVNYRSSLIVVTQHYPLTWQKSTSDIDTLYTGLVNQHVTYRAWLGLCGSLGRSLWTSQLRWRWRCCDTGCRLLLNWLIYSCFVRCSSRRQQLCWHGGDWLWTRRSRLPCSRLIGHENWLYSHHANMQIDVCIQ